MADSVDMTTERTSMELDFLIKAALPKPVPPGYVEPAEKDIVCCDSCGKRIPYERLLAVPGTKYCVKCAD